MKKYIKPKIKTIELDADQAILQVCAVGGIYLNTQRHATATYCGSRRGVFGGLPDCTATPKGGATSNFNISPADIVSGPS
ncbi:MAG: hypothetical protein PHQ52_08025 [Candidatus Omnitrophica bacterium]|nr:hypothetical protein [Candidatus Omnitrophota bacterium]